MNRISNIYHNFRANQSELLSASSSSALIIGKLELAKNIISVKNARDNKKVNELCQNRGIFTSLGKGYESKVKSLDASIENLKGKIHKREERFRKEDNSSELDNLTDKTSSYTTYRLAKIAIEKNPEVLTRPWNNLMEKKIEDTLYDIYAANKPRGHNSLNDNEKLELLSSICEASGRKDIFIQPQSGHSFVDLIKNKKSAFDEFAYFIHPKVGRNYHDGSHSRIALTVDSHKAKQIVPFLAEIVAKEQCIDCAKIMGPDEQGVRTDSAIIYFNGSDINKANEVAKQIKTIIGDTLISHTPIGMKCLIPGVSYSEFSNIHPDGGEASTSHGMARAQILTSAIKSYVMQGYTSSKQLEQVIDNKFKISGYNHKDNALLI
ncbi:hypothetical protein HJ107_02535 [Vibrio parahaemolyticus]|uniref:T3SS effector HopA1 family protein n=2 Tax=Vibrio parahaemolyticus TaxID=670 RepID=UPI0015C1531C|nr:T3SS effector HopA1 family protein [Vibrio parahaemolyticus]MBE4085721.1 hypothetical protein [Vibrio parahaemolyticus]MCQ9091988.1 hypothetical protein [Vibrio parahaemolyticus]MCX8803188.1 T3SS effector HopA1 family protein [Vibrio parahaemolyticus]MCX8828159.1 T3SS effector HopA1 family protein [Vibrio parahaemolyticus]MDF5668057.1 T3SS effector HopA1 family protein [Vibrio parahaemolyticus]